jgi:hypothetical protein
LDGQRRAYGSVAAHNHRNIGSKIVLGVFLRFGRGKFVPSQKTNLRADSAETIGVGRLWYSKKSQKGFPPMQHRVRIDEVHARAIRTEIGERLRYALSRDQLELPTSLENRLNRLREMDDDYSPSIVPSVNQH